MNLRISDTPASVSTQVTHTAPPVFHHRHHHHHHHQSLNCEGRWGTTDDFATSFLYFSLFSSALWDLPNSRPGLILSSLKLSLLQKHSTTTLDVKQKETKQKDMYNWYSVSSFHYV